MVGHKIHDHPEAQAVGFGHHDVEISQRAEDGINVAVVADGLTTVALRGTAEGDSQNGVHVQFRKLLKLLRGPRNIRMLWTK